MIPSIFLKSDSAVGKVKPFVWRPPCFSPVERRQPLPDKVIASNSLALASEIGRKECVRPLHGAGPTKGQFGRGRGAGGIIMVKLIEKNIT